MPRWVNADTLIRMGFFTQLILLALVDWGTILAFQSQDVPWYHYVGFTTVNVVLLSLTWVVWGWLKTQHTAVDMPLEARRKQEREES